MNKLSSEHWSNYWDKGTVTTFYNKFSDNYDGEIKTHWHSAFSQLPKAACVVDLATGNGALLSLLDEFAKQNKLEFSAIGIDFAELNHKITDKIVNNHIQMQEKTMIEETGLPQNSVDLAVSQFGFEYADMPAAVSELDRILKPKASINFIMHADHSMIINDGYSSLKQIKLVNQDLKLTDIVRKIIPAIHNLRETGKHKYKARADRLRDRLNESIQNMTQYAESITDPSYIDFFYEHALGLFKGDISKHHSVEQKLDQLKWVEEETSSLKMRMHDLTSVAMTATANQELTGMLESIGFKTVVIKPFEYNRGIIGQTLTASRG